MSFSSAGNDNTVGASSLSNGSSSRCSSSITFSSAGSGNGDTPQDEKFSVMLSNSYYRSKKDSEALYEVHLQHSHLHWFLLLKKKGSSLPFLLLEATTPDCKDLVRVMGTIEKYDGRLTYCGEIRGTLSSIISVADEIIEKMKCYSFFCGNCQNFCNDFLRHYKFKVQKTTICGFISEAILKMLGLKPECESLLRLILDLVSAINPDLYCSQPDLGDKLRPIEEHLRVFFASSLNPLIKSSLNPLIKSSLNPLIKSL